MRIRRAVVVAVTAASMVVGCMTGVPGGLPSGVAPVWAADNAPSPSPGFPLPGDEESGENQPGGRIDFGIDDSWPAPFTGLNNGGIPVDAPNFVNIGDSYTTTSFYATMVPEPCFHEWGGFGAMVATGTGLALRDVACPGAGLDNYWHTRKSFQFPVPKAAQRLAIDKNTKLVVASLGGNDTYTAAMYSLLAACIASWVTPNERAKGNPCERQIAPKMLPRIKRLAPAITYMLLDAKKRAAPDAVVIAMGYLSPLPRDVDYCAMQLAAPKEDLTFIMRLFAMINRQMRIAAKRAGVVYYNPAAEETKAQSTCGVPGYRSITVSGLPEYGTPFHPTLMGHYRMAEAVKALYAKELAARQQGRTIAPSTWNVPDMPKE